MEIVVRGRNVEVPEHYRQHVEDKVGQLERFDGKLKMLRMDVELFHEKNPRQSAHCQRVEITLRGKGPVVRAEADGADFYAALDLASTKLENRLRRAADRRGCTTAGGPRPACDSPATPPPTATWRPPEPSTWTGSWPKGRTSPISTSTCPAGSCGRSTIPPYP